MTSSLERVGRNQSSARDGVPPASSRTSIDGSFNGSSPSVTIRTPERVVAGSKPGPLKGIGSLKVGAGIWNDIRSRIPYYTSDWTDAWNYRVIPATTLIFFAKYGGFSAKRQKLHVTSCFSVLPGIAFSLDLIETTGKYGVAEVLLSSAMAAGVFSVFGGQPLCIAGVTGTFLGSRVLMSRRRSPSRHRSHHRVE